MDSRSALPVRRYRPTPNGHPIGANDMRDGDYVDIAPETSRTSTRRLDVLHLARKYLPWCLVLVGLGSLGGAISVVYQTPVYRASTMIEIQGINDSLMRGVLPDASSSEAINLNIQTQIRLLQSGSFLRSVVERMMTETVPPVPSGSDIFSRLRRKLRPETQDPMTVMREGVLVAQQTFQVRPINGTRLLQIDCESTHPEIASNFVNTLASEYVEQNNQWRSQNTQKAAGWLTSMLEDARVRYQESEDKLQDFVKKSGLKFVGDETPLSDMKLRQLKIELSAVQSERIAKQSQYETLKNTPADTLPQVLTDEMIHEHQAKLSELKRDVATLQTTLTPEHYKVKQVQAQVDQLEPALQREIASAVQRVRNDYEGALRKERLLSSAFAAQSHQVAAESDKAAEYNSLKREVEIAKQAHNTLLLQTNQASNSSSISINNMRLVDPSLPPQAPYKPKPFFNISFGCLLGIAATLGIAFLRESTDRSVKQPGDANPILRVPELGVIPSTTLHQPSPESRFRIPGIRQRTMAYLPEPGEAFQVFENLEGASTDLVAWRRHASLVTESFRATLASLLRGTLGDANVQVILISSPGAGEGKTTIVGNLGVALAESGRKVLIVDADFRRPRLHHMFQVPNQWGLCSILLEDSPLETLATDQLALPTPMPGLFILPNGPAAPSVQRLLHSRRMKGLLQQLRSEFDVVLIDAPPALPFADARLISRHADGVVLVLRSGITAQENAAQALDLFSADGVPMLGTILNDWKPSKQETNYYYSHYHRADSKG